MLEYLPPEIREGLEAARRREARRRSRLRVQVGDAVFPVLRLWEDGLTLDATLSPQLRGLVDIYDGARHVCQALIVASTEGEGEILCDFKRLTPAQDRAPLDFCKDENAPAGYLPRA